MINVENIRHHCIDEKLNCLEKLISSESVILLCSNDAFCGRDLFLKYPQFAKFERKE